MDGTELGTQNHPLELMPVPSIYMCHIIGLWLIPMSWCKWHLIWSVNFPVHAEPHCSKIWRHNDLVYVHHYRWRLCQPLSIVPSKMWEYFNNNIISFLFLYGFLNVKCCTISRISVATWISNYTHYKVCDEITYPFPNFNGCTVEVCEWISNFIPPAIGYVITCLCWD